MTGNANMRPKQNDFTTIYTRLRELARAHGLDPTQYNLQDFLQTVAAHCAEDARTIRALRDALPVDAKSQCV